MDNVRKDAERRSKKQSTALRHQDLHDRLVAAAEAMIAESGLASLRARTLAEAVGCSVGAIYGIFPDLDALVLTVNGRTLDAIDVALGSAGPAARPAERLAHLADAYLDYAAAHRPRWDALFQHRMPDGRQVTPWYAERLTAIFAHVEAPVAELQPGLDAAARAHLARTLFSAVHGIVQLGLDGKVLALSPSALRAQLRVVVEAVAAGLAEPLAGGKAMGQGR